MQTWRQLLQAAQVQLRDLVGEQESFAVLRALQLYLTGLKPHELVSLQDAFPAPAQFTTWKEAIKGLQAGEPLQYITGEAYFMDLKLRVSPAVLIPRPETEELVRWALSLQHTLPQPLRVVDACTGSGCIALALKHYWPLADLAAVDNSADALTIAGANAATLQLKLHLQPMDVLSAPPEAFQKLSLLISNPPYIPQREAVHLPANVLQEPKQALFVPDDNPLLFYEKLAMLGQHWLAPGGLLLVEAHEDYAHQVRLLFGSQGYTQVMLRKDLNDKPRMVAGTK